MLVNIPAPWFAFGYCTQACLTADFIGYDPCELTHSHAFSSHVLPEPMSPNLIKLDVYNLHYIARNVIHMIICMYTIVYCILICITIYFNDLLSEKALVV